MSITMAITMPITMPMTDLKPKSALGGAVLPRLALASLLLVMGIPCHAEWVKVTENNIGNFFVDPSAVVKRGPIREVTEIHNLNQVTRMFKYLSVVIQAEYDCDKKRYRNRHRQEFSDHMGQGTLIASIDMQEDWSDIYPYSPVEMTMKLVCGERSGSSATK